MTPYTKPYTDDERQRARAIIAALKPIIDTATDAEASKLEALALYAYEQISIGLLGGSTDKASGQFSECFAAAWAAGVFDGLARAIGTVIDESKVIATAQQARAALGRIALAPINARIADDTALVAAFINTAERMARKMAARRAAGQGNSAAGQGNGAD